MAPSIGCTTNLFCAEDVSGSGWDEETVSYVDGDLGGDFHSAVLLDFPPEDEEAISTLVGKELCHMPDEDYLHRFRSKILNPAARQNAISWMLKVQAFYNFGPLAVALSVNYMDRFLSRHQLPGSPFPEASSWKLQLLSVACMSLAAKMEETDVPFLLDLQVEEVEHTFEARTIQRMELLILNTLEWRMSAVTPFSYIDYFFHKLGIHVSVMRSLLERVIELLLGTLKDITFLAFRPSIVAAATTICALDEIIPLQARVYKKILCDLSICKDAVDQCYQILQEVLVDPSCHRSSSDLTLDPSCLRHSSKRKVFCSSSVPQSPVGVLEAATLASCANENTHGSCESSPIQNSATVSALKKRKVEEYCRTLYTLESL